MYATPRFFPIFSLQNFSLDVHLHIHLNIFSISATLIFVLGHLFNVQNFYLHNYTGLWLSCRMLFQFRVALQSTIILTKPQLSHLNYFLFFLKGDTRLLKQSLGVSPVIQCVCILIWILLIMTLALHVLSFSSNSFQNLQARFKLWSQCISANSSLVD